MIYLDNSATTRPFTETADAVNEALTDMYYNASSAYTPAVEVERRVELCRSNLAQAMFASTDEVYYTSGATESNNMAILGVQATLRATGHFITTKTEHPSVFDVYRYLQQSGSQVHYLDVDEKGSVRLDQLEALLTKDTSLISIMQINNETGAINDIEAASALIKQRAPQALLHVDGVQGFCKLPFAKLNCDFYSISGHKFHASKGIGALYARKGVKFAGGLIGGGQERGVRSGTTNTPGIFGMDAALKQYRAHQTEWIAHMRALKIKLALSLAPIGDVIVNGPAPSEGAPHILNISFLGVRGEVLLHALAQQGILVSTGSACSTHKKGKNRVLGAMGIEGARQEGAIRFSLCPFNTSEEIEITADALKITVAQLRRFKRR